MVLIVTISLCACTEKKTSSTDFDSIDYSFYIGSYTSIKILSTGQSYIWHESPTIWQDSSSSKENNYYSLILDKTILDSLSQMTKKLFEEKIDTFYSPEDINHPISFKLIIKSNKRTLSTKYFGGLERVKWRSLFNMALFLNHQCEKVTDHNHANFVYESRVRLRVLPPPPPDSN